MWYSSHYFPSNVMNTTYICFYEVWLLNMCNIATLHQTCFTFVDRDSFGSSVANKKITHAYTGTILLLINIFWPGIICVRRPIKNIVKVLECFICVKDARSVSEYPYNGHKSCNMLSMQNELPLQMELPNFVTNNVGFFLTKSKNT